MKKIFLFALAVMLTLTLLLLAACGEAQENEVNPGVGVEVEDSGQAPADYEQPTLAPEPEEITEEPTTEEPTEPIDPDLPYWEYAAEEFRRFGFEGGDWIVAETEQGILDILRGKDVTKNIIDVSDQDVPFESAARFEISREANDFWDISAELNFAGGKTLSEGDIIAGVMWLRDGGGSNPAQTHLAIKTPTDNWGSEGDMNVTAIGLDPGEGWRKIYFCGEIAVDEDPASTAILCMFLGYEPHTIEMGGFYIMRFPPTGENMRAGMRMPLN